jgi:ATP-dependent DNA ligase
MAAPVPKCWRPFFHRLPIRTMTNGGHGNGGSITGRFRTELNSTGSNSQLAASAVDAQLRQQAGLFRRAGTGMPVMELERLWRRLQPLQVQDALVGTTTSRSAGAQPGALGTARNGRQGQYAEWTPDGLLRHVVYLSERENKPANEMRRDPP